MKELFASSAAGMTGLLFFFVFFVGVVLWVFRPGSKKKYSQDARIPLEEKE
ncbi:MAG: CcoQ/FixQ family Cbb3-type cytochrome c oxidase assembly chaperone [Alphaproteobacteria bacterium]|nr:CcoQ/FixQ family Cbb3-type cytochrome c oxidase assembly chaperone [Alphaproteobacteria bacterium]HCQ70514.1 CcoQ/FixQ family Cbb3-type cytochrome c oxidase assembly chaperone [Rhodospirillaceae bacterium]|tara:strand:+ start:52321 stop:52473 length:153 start_codon:yes stop_codon:yes gene_type:complete